MRLGSRAVQPPDLGAIIEIAEVGGLHHRYERRAGDLQRTALLSEGVRFVVVNGVLALDLGKVVEGVAPGQWLRHTCASESSSGH